MVINRLPNHFARREFLPFDERSALLEWIIANRARFTPAKVAHEGSGARIGSVRTGLKLRDLGPQAEPLTRRLLEILPEISGALGCHAPHNPKLELEITAYGDGAFYAAHRDIMVGAGRTAWSAHAGEDRLLSAVYYLHIEPKAFTGGTLDLFRFGVEPAKSEHKDRVRVEPDDNKLIAFPSWVFHEVMPVSCPGNRFENHRFAVNCWYCAPLA